MFEKTQTSFFRVRKLNQERFTLATDDTIEGLRNGVKKIPTQQKVRLFG